MKSFKKLNARGFAHHFILVGIVLVVAIGGTYELVASHADNCNPVSGASDPTSGASDPASSPACSSASDPVTAPALTYLASCSITGVPATLQADADFTPHILVTNIGTGLITPTINYALTNNAGANVAPTSGTVAKTSGSLVSTNQIAPGISQSFIVLPQYVPPAPTTAPVSYTLNVSVTTPGNTQQFSCKAPVTVALPLMASVTINPADWQTLTAASITTDKPEGNVIKLNASNGSTTPSSVSTTGKVLLGKLGTFVVADYNQKAQLCLTARSASSSQLTVTMVGVTGAGTTLASLTKTYTPTLKSTYTTPCYSFTIGNYKVNSAAITIQNKAGSAASYVNNVTLSLQ